MAVHPGGCLAVSSAPRIRAAVVFRLQGLTAPADGDRRFVLQPVDHPAYMRLVRKPAPHGDLHQAGIAVRAQLNRPLNLHLQNGLVGGQPVRRLEDSAENAARYSRHCRKRISRLRRFQLAFDPGDDPKVVGMGQNGHAHAREDAVHAQAFGADYAEDRFADLSKRSLPEALTQSLPAPFHRLAVLGPG